MERRGTQSGWMLRSGLLALTDSGNKLSSPSPGYMRVIIAAVGRREVGAVYAANFP
jgi:hypothetical protein